MKICDVKEYCEVMKQYGLAQLEIDGLSLVMGTAGDDDKLSPEAIKSLEAISPDKQPTDEELLFNPMAGLGDDGQKG